jgi:hypothetical protein
MSPILRRFVGQVDRVEAATAPLDEPPEAELGVGQQTLEMALE